MASVELSVEEISVLDAALRLYEEAGGMAAMDGVAEILKSRFPASSPFGDAIEEAKKKAKQEAELRRRQVLLLRAKLCMALEVPIPPPLVSDPGT